MLPFKTVRLESQESAFHATLAGSPWKWDGESFNRHIDASLFLRRTEKAHDQSKQEQCSACIQMYLVVHFQFKANIAEKNANVLLRCRLHPNLHPNFCIYASQFASQFLYACIPICIPISSSSHPNLHPNFLIHASQSASQNSMPQIPIAETDFSSPNPNCQSKPS